MVVEKIVLDTVFRAKVRRLYLEIAPERSWDTKEQTHPFTNLFPPELFVLKNPPNSKKDLISPFVTLPSVFKDEKFNELIIEMTPTTYYIMTLDKSLMLDGAIVTPNHIIKKVYFSPPQQQIRYTFETVYPCTLAIKTKIRPMPAGLFKDKNNPLDKPSMDIIRSISFSDVEQQGLIEDKYSITLTKQMNKKRFQIQFGKGYEVNVDYRKGIHAIALVLRNTSQIDIRKIRYEINNTYDTSLKKAFDAFTKNIDDALYILRQAEKDQRAPRSFADYFESDQLRSDKDRTFSLKTIKASDWTIKL